MSTPEPIDIDKALREIISRTGAIAKDPLARGEVRTLAAAVAMLALVVGEQEKRLRIIEPCAKREDGGPHLWAPIGKKFSEPGDPLRCVYCDARKADR